MTNQTEASRKAFEEAVLNIWTEPNINRTYGDSAYQHPMTVCLERLWQASEQRVRAEVAELVKFVERVRNDELEKYPWEQGYSAMEPEEKAEKFSEYYRLANKALRPFTDKRGA